MAVRDTNLSILLHGGVFYNKSEELASYVLQYRKNFPDAEIVLSISSSDFIDRSKSSFRKVASLTEDGERFCRVINESVDKIVFCSKAFVLPPVKDGNANCNVNYLIESVRNGLDVISRPYVLRVRNDILFIDRRFIDEYERLNSLERGDYSCFSSRIMISSLFTLNPYGVERFPFHFSDWFHFGKVEDVNKLWDIDFIDIQFATYFHFNKPLLGSYAEERKFNFRLAIEQYIVFSFFKKIFPQLSLDVCNDLTSRAESVKVLLDNFIVVDMANVGIYFPKYAQDQYVLKNNDVCIMQDTWEYLASHRQENIESYLHVSYGDHESFRLKKMPFRFEMNHFFSDVGFHSGGSLVAPLSSPNGPITMGPFVTLPKGRYRVNIFVSTLLGKELPKLKISIIADGWNIVLVSRIFMLDKAYPAKDKAYVFSIAFENKFDELKNLEIVLEKMSRFEIAIDSIEIDEQGESVGETKEGSLRDDYIDLDDLLYSQEEMVAGFGGRNIGLLEKNMDLKKELINSLRFKLFKLCAGSFMAESLSRKLENEPVRFVLDSKSKLVKYVFRGFFSNIG